MHRTQELAAQVVEQVDKGRTLTEALTRLLRNDSELSSSTRGAVQDISYGILRHKGELNYWLRTLVPKPLPHEALERLLLVAIYQLAYTRAAPYAVVDHAVKHAGHIAGGRLKGLVNGVLRNFQRREEELRASSLSNEEARYNHPAWWIRTLRRAYPQDWQAIMLSSNTHPPMTLRINARVCDASQYLQKLEQAGMAGTILGSHAVRLEKPLPVRELPGFAEGEFSVQDFGAQQAAPMLALTDGMRVLDACAAPGGKTCHMLELAEVEVTALDVDETRLLRVRDNLARLKLSANVLAGDAGQPAAWWDGRLFDRILADVPCTASGVVRRHPDIKWLRRPGDFAELARQQEQLVDALWPLLARGGKMLYATCSIMPEENGQQLTAFLSRHADARLVNAEQLLPCPDHDGFYYALLEKI
ncbi:16S rRNA (cytosine(967)-C(5))-methyltransferase RsmB [Craterilacuibacter sp.]|uniref:16S rRNA (cytosine(967)-C(5))-methyltransferase RsmB n=1 Tax=Craterilacuibacter sp. TaxID=2870909 RepID=UPI003F40ABD0